jgi:DNA-directed RNA polymerase specialized sigma24 family protein
MAKTARKIEQAAPEHKAKVYQFKQQLTDEELYGLIKQYACYYRKKFEHEWHMQVDEEDIFGELAVKAMEAKARYEALEEKRATLRTWLVRCFHRHMLNHRKYLHKRQVEHRMLRITKC